MNASTIIEKRAVAIANNPKWAAVVARDAAVDGRFVEDPGNNREDFTSRVVKDQPRSS